MKTRLLITGFFVAGMALGAGAQVQANKQLQMTGASNNDRRITGVGIAADSADAVNAATLLGGRLTYAPSTASGNNYAVVLRVAPESYATGMILSFKAAWANTGAITLNVNGLGERAVFKNVNEALEAGDIVPNQVVSVIYDGTAFQILSQLRTVAGFKGNLSGDVVGTQENTLISNDAVTTTKIADGAVTNDKVAPGISYSKLVDVPTALPPTGDAAGDLEGQFPAPQVKAGAITESKLADGAVNTLKIQDGAIISLKLADGSVLTAKIADAAITTAKIADGAVTNEKIASVDYSKITNAPAALPPTGDAGGDLEGQFPAPLVKAGAVSTAKIQDGAVTNDKVAYGISYGKLVDVPTALPPTGDAGGDLEGQFPSPSIKAGAVTGAKVASGAIANEHVAAGAAIDYAKLNLAGSIATTDLADASVATTKMADASVTTSKVADGAITNEKITSLEYSKITGAPTAMTPSGTAGGDLAGNYPAPVVRDAAITDNKIAAGAVTESRLADGAVTSAKLAAGAVGTAAVADAAITNEKIASVAYGKITGAPTSMAPTGAAGGDLTGTYPAPQIKDAAITDAKIATGAVTGDKINTAGAASGQVLSYNGSGVVWTTPATVLTGAAGGDLTGAYPAPSIAPGVVTTGKLAAGAVTNDKVAYGISYNKLVDVPTALPPTGDASGDLTGSYPAPVIAAGAVTGAKVAPGAITNSHVAAGAAIDYAKLNLTGSITGSDLADASVSTAKIVSGAVTNEKIASVEYSKITNAPTALPPTGAASGDLTGTYPAPVIAAGAVTNEKIASVDYSKITNAPAALPPTGDAGGDLEGQFPAPLVKAGAVSTAKIQDGAVTASKIAAGAVGTAAVADAAITDVKIASVDFSKITGVPAFIKTADAAGGDLTGTYPDPEIKAEAVTTTKIAAGAVTVDKINTAGAVSGHVLTYDGAGAVWAVANTHPTGAAGGDLTGTYPDPTIADGAVNSTKLATGAVTNSHIAPLANIDYSKLNLANKIVSTDLTNNSVTTFKIANSAVTTSKISSTGATPGQVLTYNGSTVAWGTVSSVPGGAASGDLSGTYPNPVVANGVITSAKIADGAITNADINASAAIAYSKLSLNNSITGNDITNGAISNSKIADGAITSAKVADGAITDAKIAYGIDYSKLVGAPTSLTPSGAAGGDLTGEYPTPSIATGAVTDVKIADGAVVTNKLGYGAVATDKLADGAVTPEKISAVGAASGQVLSFNGSQVVWASPAGSGATALQFHGSINSAVAYPSGSTVAFPVVETNVGGQMNAATGTFTAAEAGLYQFNASLPSTADGARFLALRVNGFDVFTGSGATAFTAGSPYNATVSALSLSVAYPLQAGDQVEIVVHTASGSATPLTNGSARLLITRF